MAQLVAILSKAGNTIQHRKARSVITAPPYPSTQAEAPKAPGSISTHRWSFGGLFSFRFTAVFLLLSVLVVFEPFVVLPWLGPKLAGWMFQPSYAAPQWIAQHVLHLTGAAAQPHSTDSRDTAFDWIQMGLITVLSLCAAIVWSALDRNRKHYQTAAAWLRFLLRLFLFIIMLRYGLMKVFPLQMSRPSLAVLNEPLGSSSPMTLLWTLIGLHPAYQILCGAIETLCAVLLFFRRTALLGALLTAFVMSNVLLYNLFFDVPVKLGAGLILLVTLAIIAPDLPALYVIFWRREPSALTAIWIPPHSRRSFKTATRVVEWAALLLALYYFIPSSYQEAKTERENVLHPSPVAGEWRVDSVLRDVNGKAVSTPILTAEGVPMTALFLEPDGRAMARSQDGRLWRAGADIDIRKHTLDLYSGYFEGTRFQGSYVLRQPDPDHLILTPTSGEAKTYGTISLTRVPLPASYPLLERRFHWVNEWALER